MRLYKLKTTYSPLAFTTLLFVLLQCPVQAQIKGDTLQANQFMMEAEIHHDSGHYEKGIIQLNKALHLYQSALGPVHLRVADVWDKIGASYNRQYKIEASKEAHQKALDIRQKTLESEDHILIATSYYMLGIVEDDKGDYPEALKLYQKAIDIHSKVEGDPAFAGKIHFQMGNIFKEQSQFLEALRAYQKAGELWTPHFYEERPILASYVHNGLGNVYNQLGNYGLSLENYQKALEIQLKVLGKKHPRTPNMYNNIAILYNDMGKYDVALEYHQQVLAARQELLPPDHPHIAYSYTNLGAVYGNLQQNDRALEHNQQALLIYQANHDAAHTRVIMAHTSLGNSYNRLGQYNKALEYLQKAIQGLESPKNEGLIYIDPYLSIAEVYRNQGDFEQALFYHQKANNLLDTKEENDYPEISKININLAISKIYQESGNFEKATEYLYISQALLRQAVRDKHPRISAVFLNLAEVDEQAGQLETALLYCDSALMSLDWHADKSQAKENLYLAPRIFSALSTKARILAALYQAQGERQILESAAQHYQYALQLFHQSKHNYQTADERQSFVGRSYIFFEEAIKNHLLFYQKTQDKKHLYQAFIFSEESKSLSLQEVLERPVLTSSVPEELQQEEQRLKSDIFFYEKQCFLEAEKGKAADQKLIEGWQNQLFDLKESYRQLKKELDQSYPHEYAALQTISDISTIQNQMLNKQETLLEFFIGKSKIYAFLLQKDQISVEMIPKDFLLETWINQMRESIYQYWITPDRPDSLYASNNATYLQTAHQLYQKLFSPLEPHLTERIIVVPDKALHLLPFDALLTQPPGQEWNFRNLPYLLRKYQISYTYSAAIQFKIETRDHPRYTNSLIAFAPAYQATEQYSMAKEDQIRQGLGPLKYNTQECEQIQGLWGGALFLNAAATKEAFLEAIIDPAQVIHLASHAKANAESGDFSFICFSGKADEANNNNRIYLQDLYTLSIPTEMVVLSACETGIGEIKAGEGIINLALGFTYAGANSVITSLWSVDDLATMELMDRFYQKLKTGLPKDQALQAAKIQFIEETPNASPFFWAGFIPTGKMTKFKNTAPFFANNSFVWLGLLALSLFAGWYFFRKT